MYLDSNWSDWVVPFLIDGLLLLGLFSLIVTMFTRQPRYLILASVLITPFILYLAGHPGLRWVWVIPVAMFVLGCIVYIRSRPHSAQ